MAPSDPAPVVGGVAFALCPLLCIGVPVLVTAGISSGLALAIGGAVIGGVVLVALAVGMLVVLSRRRAGACCEPAAERTPRSSDNARPVRGVTR
jgi:hypothetical protein